MGQSYEQLGAGHYLLAKLMWDKDADARELERRYYDALYGEAGRDLLAYYRLLEERLRKMYLENVDVDEPAVTQLLERKSSGGSPARILAAYWPILDEATGLMERAQSRQLKNREVERLERLLDHHEYLVATVRGMIAAGRLEQQTHLNPDEYTAVSPTFGGYHLPARFARLILADAPIESWFKYGTFEDVPADSVAEALRFNSEGDASLDVGPNHAYCGSQAAHITVGEAGYGGFTLEARVKPNTSYRAVIAHYNSVGALRPDVRDDTPRTRVIFRSKGGKAVTNKSEYSWDGAKALDGPSRWRIMSHLFTTPQGTERISFTLFFHHPGEYWVDEVRLEEL